MPSTFAFAYLCLAFAALDLSTFLNSQCGAGTSTTTSAEAPLLLHGAAEVLLPSAAVGALYGAVALTYHYLSRRHVAAAVPATGAGHGRRSTSRLVKFVLCISVGALQFILFGHGQAAGGGGAGHGVQARALGLAALRALPAAATVTFFCGVLLIVVVVAHVRAGGEGGGTGAVAGDGPIQGLLRLLTKIAAGAAAALVGLMAMALTLCGANLVSCRY